MSFSPRYSPAIVFAVLCLSASIYAQTTTKQVSKVSRGSVSGRVTIKEKGAPGIVVGLRKADGMPPLEPFQRATTDQDGAYRITNLAPGSYSLTLSAPAYVMTDERVSRFKNIVVGEDENVEGVNFALVRGGVITGRVTDADGRVVIEQPVNIYRADGSEPRSQQVQVYSPMTVQTDDRGIYRAFGLMAGRYTVAAGRSEDDLTSSYSPTRVAIYRQVFHSEITDPSKPKIIDVSDGSEATGVDITLSRAVQTFSVSGQVIDPEKNSPAPNVRFGLQRFSGERAELMNSMSSSNSRGEFLIEGLIPGRYGLYMLPVPGEEKRIEPTTFEIATNDVAGLVVRLIRGASVSGVIVLESQDKSAFAKLSQLQLRALSMMSASSFVGSGTSPIAPDGSFRFTGLAAGSINFLLGSVTNIMGAKGFSVVRVERDGVVAARGIDLKEGEQVTGVRIIVAYGSATVRGVVKLENGSLLEGTRIFVRLTKPGEGNLGLRPATVDARGHFLLDGIPAGTYEVVAMIVGGAVGPPRTVKRALTIQDGEVAEIALTIDLSGPVKP